MRLLWDCTFFDCFFFFFFKQKTAYEIVSRDWSSDVCSSDLVYQIICELGLKLPLLSWYISIPLQYAVKLDIVHISIYQF